MKMIKKNIATWSLPIAIIAILAIVVLVMSQRVSTPLFEVDKLDPSAEEFMMRTQEEKTLMVSGKVTEHKLENDETVFCTILGGEIQTCSLERQRPGPSNLTDSDKDSIMNQTIIQAPVWMFWEDKISIKGYNQILVGIMVALMYGLAFALEFGLVAGLVNGLAFALVYRLAIGLMFGQVLALGFALAFGPVLALAFIILDSKLHKYLSTP